MHVYITHKLVRANVQVGGGCGVDRGAAARTHLLTFQGKSGVS